ncbi:hypothetical protein [Streptomyces sp. CB03911]|uniref:hypothetical protein n=1 Tax=Streptomyces sp. CB03911 TaxID=1804758 RepID=UPI000940007D|nr:hypothetical protein [Streptomyces sp. CB03911]OKI25095.1 hypothetical protein A6A07_31355 [Streptomyces sp. CB03911]
MTPDQQSDQPPGQRLHDAMQQASSRFGPHRADLVTLAAARGRRLRLVRRVQLGALGVLVAGAGVLGTAQFLPAPADRAPAVGPDLPASATPSAAPSATPSAAPTRSPAPVVSPATGGPRSGPVSEQLAAFLPPGTTTRVSSSGSIVEGRVAGNPGDRVSGSVLYDDGKGPAVVSVSVLDAVLDSVDCGRETPPVCQVLPDGTAVRTDKLTLAGGQLLWTVSATRPDGRRASVSASNSDRPITDSGHPTRTEPPLTTDQLQAIATSPHWDRRTP